MSEQLIPLEGKILAIDNGFAESEAKIAKASEDYRLKAIVATIAETVEGQSPDYRFIDALLDDLERDYGLLPVEVVEAYHICERKYEYAQMEMLDA